MLANWLLVWLKSHFFHKRFVQLLWHVPVTKQWSKWSKCMFVKLWNYLLIYVICAIENLFFICFTWKVCAEKSWLFSLTNLILLFSLAGRMMSVTPDPDTFITISRLTSEPDCSVCVDKPPKQKCDPKGLNLRDPRNTSIEFTCPQPQDVFNVEINREIGTNISTLRFHFHFYKHVSSGF